MWDFSILLSVKLVLRTLPFLFLRAIVSLVFSGIIVIAPWAGIVLIRYLADIEVLPRAGLLLLVGALLGLSVALWLLRWMRLWVVYLVKAAHIAVLVELVQGQPLPGGRSQIGYGQRVVRERFGEASALFLLDQLVKSVLRAIDRFTIGALTFLPNKTGAQIATTIRTFLFFGFGYLDEIVLAHAIRNRANDPWGSARDALVLYGQNWKTILKNAFWLTLFTFMSVAPIVGSMVLPALSEYQAAPAPETLRPLVIGILVTAAVSGMFMGPFALVCLIQVWCGTISEDRPSSAWSARISQIAPQLDQYRGPRMGVARKGGTTRNGDFV